MMSDGVIPEEKKKKRLWGKKRVFKSFVFVAAIFAFFWQHLKLIWNVIKDI